MIRLKWKLVHVSPLPITYKSWSSYCNMQNPIWSVLQQPLFPQLTLTSPPTTLSPSSFCSYQISFLALFIYFFNARFWYLRAFFTYCTLYLKFSFPIFPSISLCKSYLLSKAFSRHLPYLNSNHLLWSFTIFFSIGTYHCHFNIPYILLMFFIIFFLQYSFVQGSILSWVGSLL